MARKSLEVPTDFLDKIEEEKREDNKILAKKYPFNRTTTPNTLREHLKETLVKNIGSITDLAETIHAIKDDEILDTFNIDSENIETPPVQRRAFRHKSFRLPSQDQDNESDMGSDFSGRRKNHKFRSLTGDGKALGDRELVIKRKKESNTDLSEGRRAATDLEDELGSGLFDRFSSARKTLQGRSSLRRKKDEEEALIEQDTDKKLKSDNWRSKIANKFRKSSDSYDFVEAERGQELRDYLGQVTPMTEPVRRKPFNIDEYSTQGNGDSSSLSVRQDRRERTKSRIEPEDVSRAAKAAPRKGSYTMAGDYDSTLVDGKYVTSVPIISVEEEEEGEAPEPDPGNIRPGHSLKDLKKPDNRRNSLIERLSRSASIREAPKAAGANVFDRLAGGKSGSRSSLSSSRPSLNQETRASTSSLTGRGASRANSLPPEKPKGTFMKIRDLSKDITKNLRKGKEDSLVGSTIVQPRSSQTLFSNQERRPMTNLNGGSRSNINSSTRSLNKSTSGRESPKSVRLSALSGSRTITSRPSSASLLNSSNNLKSSVRTPVTKTSSVGVNGRATSSKENLSRSSSSASRSSVTNSNGMSRNGSLRTGGVTTPGTISSRTVGLARGTSTLPKTSRPTQNGGMSFMKPTAASAKKVLGPSSSTDSSRKGAGTKPATLTTAASRVNPVSAKPTRR